MINPVCAIGGGIAAVIIAVVIIALAFTGNLGASSNCF